MPDNIRTERHYAGTAEIEYRRVQLDAGYETRDDGAVILRGYASVFNSPSEWLGFREVVAPGAFARSLESNNDIKALVEHDPARIVARMANNSLQLGEDAHGLWVRIEPNESTEGRDLIENVRTGLLSQMSIGFRVLCETWEDRDGEALRTLTEVDLVETSIVADPAYRATTIDVADRSFGDVVVVDEQNAGQWSDALVEALSKQTKPIEPQPDPPADHSRLRARLDLLERM